MLYSRTLLFIHSLYNSLHLLTPNSQSIPSPSPSPLGNHKSVLYVCESMKAPWKTRSWSISESGQRGVSKEGTSRTPRWQEEWSQQSIVWARVQEWEGEARLAYSKSVSLFVSQTHSLNPQSWDHRNQLFTQHWCQGPWIQVCVISMRKPVTELNENSYL